MSLKPDVKLKQKERPRLLFKTEVDKIFIRNSYLIAIVIKSKSIEYKRRNSINQIKF